MTSDESYKQPVYLCRDPKATQQQAFERFVRENHEGRAYTKLPCGGYQLVDGNNIYRVTLYGPMSAVQWGVYIDFDAMKGGGDGVIDITGTVILRDTPVKLGSHPGKRIMCVIGVIAVPEDCNVKTGHQYPLLGFCKDEVIHLSVATDVPVRDIDGAKEYRGYTADQLLTSPIWRV